MWGWAAVTTTTQVQWTEQLLQRAPAVYHFEHLVLGCVHPGMKRGREKKKKSHVPIRVSLLILEARINFLSYSSRRGSILEFPSGILLKHSGTPLNPMFFGREPTSLTPLHPPPPSQHSISPHIQVFTLCWGKNKTSVNSLAHSG